MFGLSRSVNFEALPWIGWVALVGLPDIFNPALRTEHRPGGTLSMASLTCADNVGDVGLGGVVGSGAGGAAGVTRRRFLESLEQVGQRGPVRLDRRRAHVGSVVFDVILPGAIVSRSASLAEIALTSFVWLTPAPVRLAISFFPVFVDEYVGRRVDGQVGLLRTSGLTPAFVNVSIDRRLIETTSRRSRTRDGVTTSDHLTSPPGSA